MDIQRGIKKSCENCRYFSQHYIKQRTRIASVSCGHCIHKNTKYIKRRVNELCEKWEGKAIAIEERKKSIKASLKSMAERLDEICLILKDDNE